MGVLYNRGLEGEPIPLTRFQRMLVGTDGTVTHLLEAYAGEPMDVVKLLQEFGTLADPHAELDLARGDRVLRRRVVLRGRRSGQTMLYAEALVAVSRVEPGFLDALHDTDKPLGIVLADRRAETFREILRVTAEPAGDLGAHFGLDPGDSLVARTYRIVAGSRPVILITERFPTTYFRHVPG